MHAHAHERDGRSRLRRMKDNNGIGWGRRCKGRHRMENWNVVKWSSEGGRMG